MDVCHEDVHISGAHARRLMQSATNPRPPNIELCGPRHTCPNALHDCVCMVVGSFIGRRRRYYMYRICIVWFLYSG